ncbi:MAG: YggS family pyridoxal phosphate-dependent enzyme [Bacteroidales bacterium]|nr:YggS family pyridoxal phosphate-dependent enzyme [Bacteroidales bacterium]
MIKENLAKVKASIPEGVTLVAVSKFHPAEMIAEAYEQGQRIFAESRENEFRDKVSKLPKDIIWHFIGHLQTNKVKYVVPYASMIQSIDSERLLDEVEKQMQKTDRSSIDVLLQLHVAQEETKSGFLPDEIMALLSQNCIAERWPHIRLRGVMGMASFVDDAAQWRREFGAIRACHKALLDGPLKAQGISAEQFSILSYGMSEDYPVAIEEGSNMVRVGTSIFGPRNY